MSFSAKDFVIVMCLRPTEEHIDIKQDYHQYRDRQHMICSTGQIIRVHQKEYCLVKMDGYSTPLWWHELSLSKCKNRKTVEELYRQGLPELNSFIILVEADLGSHASLDSGREHEKRLAKSPWAQVTLLRICLKYENAKSQGASQVRHYRTLVKKCEVCY